MLQSRIQISTFQQREKQLKTSKYQLCIFDPSGKSWSWFISPLLIAWCVSCIQITDEWNKWSDMEKGSIYFILFWETTHDQSTDFLRTSLFLSIQAHPFTSCLLPCLFASLLLTESPTSFPFLSSNFITAFSFQVSVWMTCLCLELECSVSWIQNDRKVINI